MFKRLGLLSIFLILFTLSSCTNTIEVTISFESNGGSVVQPITINEETSLQFPDDPTKEGYVFAGWYWDNTFSELFTLASFIERDITSNLIVYAKWDELDSNLTVQLKNIYSLAF